MRLHCGLAALSAVTVGLLVGCGSSGASTPTGNVSGKVTFNGQPVTAGTVSFFDPKTGSGNGAKLGAEGAYAIDALPVGDYAVTVTPPVVEPPAVMKEGDPPFVPPESKDIPKKYRAAGTSDLKFTVKAGPNTGADFDMKP